MTEKESEIDALSGVNKEMLSRDLKNYFVDCFLQEFPKDNATFEFDEPGVFQQLFTVLNDKYIKGELHHIGSLVEETITPSHLGPYINFKPDTDKMYVLKEGSTFQIEYIHHSVYAKVLISPEDCGSDLCSSCLTIQNGKYLLSPRMIKERASKLVNSALFGLTVVFHCLHDELVKEIDGHIDHEETQFSVNTDITGPSIKLSYKGYNEDYRPDWISVTYPEEASEEEMEAINAEDHVSTQEADFVLAIQLTEIYSFKPAEHGLIKITENYIDVTPRNSNSGEMCTDYCEGAFLHVPSDPLCKDGGFKNDTALHSNGTCSSNFQESVSYEDSIEPHVNKTNMSPIGSQISSCRTNAIKTFLPLPAHPWVSRERKWPSREIIANVLEQDYYVVPKSSSIEKQDIEWRLSFSKAEITLMRSLSRNSWCKHSYRIFKCLMKYHLDRPKVISTYHCKTVFFWTLEQHPPDTWSDKNLGERLLLLLDRLLHALVQRRLDHYFVPEHNLFENINADFVFDIAKRVSDIRLRPLSFIYRKNVVPWDSDFQGMTVEEMLEYDPNDFP